MFVGCIRKIFYLGCKKFSTFKKKNLKIFLFIQPCIYLLDLDFFYNTILYLVSLKNCINKLTTFN